MGYQITNKIYVAQGNERFETFAVTICKNKPNILQFLLSYSGYRVTCVVVMSIVLIRRTYTVDDSMCIVKAKKVMKTL